MIKILLLILIYISFISTDI